LVSINDVTTFRAIFNKDEPKDNLMSFVFLIYWINSTIFTTRKMRLSNSRSPEEQEAAGQQVATFLRLSAGRVGVPEPH
jgi:hypothetical protein